MEEDRGGNDRVVDLNTVGDGLATRIEEAARRGQRLVLGRGDEQLAIVIPTPGLRARERAIDDEELLDLLAAVRAQFADQSEEDIERETAAALAEVRAEAQTERTAVRRAS